MPDTASNGAGRPKESRVTSALLEAVLEELAANGFEGATIAAIAARATTSKQAVYRRYADKAELVAAAVRHTLDQVNPAPPQRASVAEDLRLCLKNTVDALQQTPLGGAIRVLAPYRQHPALKSTLDDLEANRRLVLRQIFIATPFESDMEIRIDLLLGLIYFRLLIRDIKITPEDIETAIYLVLGLVAPRDPASSNSLPGV
ncbi:MAG: TetR-like C-terminal domain-containing protein [Roseibium sp.]